MDLSLPLESSLVTRCPHCGHHEPDEFETLMTREIAAMRCAECRRHFPAVLMECDVCGEEHVFAWEHAPSAFVVDHLTCPACTRSYVCSEADSCRSELHG
jgi:hypothetical protein